LDLFFSSSPSTVSKKGEIAIRRRFFHLVEFSEQHSTGRIDADQDEVTFPFFVVVIAYFSPCDLHRLSGELPDFRLNFSAKSYAILMKLIETLTISPAQASAQVPVPLPKDSVDERSAAHTLIEIPKKYHCSFLSLCVSEKSPKGKTDRQENFDATKEL
jgi:hypothetical protein